jgi:hypothetical protein
MAQTKCNAIPLFCCLTYPDIFPADPVTWKNDLKKFTKRLVRKFPKASFLWRLHTLKRKSGDNAGQVAPHFHLLVWGVGLADLRGFVSQAWYETVASGDQRHLRAGTSVEMPRCFKAVMRYVSDEFAKLEQATPVDNVGRWWGFYRRKHIPWADPFRFPVADQDAVKIMRWFRRLASDRIKRGRDRRRFLRRSYKSLSVFANADFWFKKIRAGPDPPGSYGAWASQFEGV